MLIRAPDLPSSNMWQRHHSNQQHPPPVLGGAAVCDELGIGIWPPFII